MQTFHLFLTYFQILLLAIEGQNLLFTVFRRFSRFSIFFSFLPFSILASDSFYQYTLTGFRLKCFKILFILNNPIICQHYIKYLYKYIKSCNNYLSMNYHPTNQQMWNMPLLQLLRLGNSMNVYALALAKSRNQQLTTEIGSILEEYVFQDGDRWLEVVRRLVQNNYQIRFEYAINSQVFLQPLISQMYTQRATIPNINRTCQKIWERIEQSVRQYNKDPSMQLLRIKNIQFFIEIALKYRDMVTLQQIFALLSSQSKILANMLTAINRVSNQNNIKQEIDHGWEWHYIAIKLLLSVVTMANILQGQAVRQIRYHRFLDFLSKPVQQNYSIEKIIKYYLPSVIVLLGTVNINQFPNNTPICSQVFRLISEKQKEKLTDYYSKICLIITHTSTVTSLEPIFLKNTPMLSEIVRIIECIDIIKLNNYMHLDQELLALNAEIASNAYSDTLTGNFMNMVVLLCNNVGGFFNLYFSYLDHLARSDILKACNPDYFINCLLKICLLSDSTILLNRQQEVEKLLSATASLFSQQWSTYNEWQQVQVLRYFMIFVNRGNRKGLGVTETAEELISKCIDLCLAALTPCFHKMDDQNNIQEIQFTPLQEQCYDLLKSLPQTPNTLRLIKQSLLPNLLSIFIHLPPTTTFIQLFHNYLINIPELVSRSSQQIIEYFTHAFIHEKRYFQSISMKSLKCIEKISKILRAIITILTSESELSFNQIEEKIVEPILSNLGDKNSDSYEDQLLELLETVLIKHSHLTFSVCQILSKLPSIYEKNEKKLSILRNIYKALSISNEIKKQIQYQYGDIVLMMLMMANDYIQNSLNYDELLFYPTEVKELICMIEIFLNKYTAKIVEDDQMLEIVGVRMFNGLKICLQNTKNSFSSNSSSQMEVNRLEFYQLVFQLQMVIAHICTNPSASKFNSRIIAQVAEEIKIAPFDYFTYLQTIKMIPVVIIDQLLINAADHEKVITVLISYCKFMTKLEISSGMSKQWKSIEGVEHWDQWPKDIKKYIEGTLRQLRSRKQIDQVDHAQYLQEINKVLI